MRKAFGANGLRVVLAELSKRILLWHRVCIGVLSLFAGGRCETTPHTIMTYGLYMSAEGAAVQSQRMEVLANNLANVDTVGFKRQMAIPQARHAEAIEQGLAAEGSGSENDIGGGVEVDGTLTDFSQGVLRKTGAATDFAIEGRGFFVVDGGDSQRLLTRAGNFRMTDQGRLITQQGYAVLSQDRTPIDLLPNLPWTVGKDGTITQGATSIKLALVEPQSGADLIHAGENNFRSLSQALDVSQGERRIASGFLELSGVRPTTEMMEMIEASRAFESNVKLMQSQDEMIGQLLSRVLRQP